MYNYKRLIGELFGAAIAIVWICFALLAPGNMTFLTVGVCFTIVFGILSGGFLKLSTIPKDNSISKAN